MTTRIKLDTDKFRFITLFETMTGAHVKDCITTDNKLTFIVHEGHAAKAIGKKGVNIKNLQKAVKQNIEVIEYSSNPVNFIKNFFRPARMSNLYSAERSDGSKVMHLTPESDKGLIRSKLARAKKFVKKYYDINDIIVH